MLAKIGLWDPLGTFSQDREIEQRNAKKEYANGSFWEFFWPYVRHVGAHTVGAPAKIDPCRARVKGPDLIFLKNVEMPKKGRKLVEAYFFQKCLKSISLDSGHLD